MSNANVLKIVADIEMRNEAVKKQLDEIKNTVARVTNSSTKVAALEMSRNMRRYENELKASTLRVERLSNNLRTLAQKNQLSAAEKASMLSQKKELVQYKNDLIRMERKYKVEEVLSQRLIRKRQDALDKSLEKSARTFTEKISAGIEDSTEVLSQTFQDLKNFNPTNILKRLGSAVESKGHAMSAHARKYGTNVMSKNMMDSVGQMLVKLGPAVLAIGALSAGLVAVVGILIEADSKVKELNRSLMQTGSISGDMVNDLGTVTENLDKVRQSFAGSFDAFTFNQSWRTTAKEHLEILASYSEAGTTLKELRSLTSQNVSEMDQYREATIGALAFSKLLGLSTGEVTSSFTRYMDQLGVNLKTIEEKFSGINMAARESGFGVKNFFSRVLEATSGLSMYNVRLEESAGLLKDLGGIIGKEHAGAYLQDLNKSQKSESTIERTRKVMIMGQERALDIYSKDAVSQVKDFQQFYSTLKEDQKKTIDDAFLRQDIDITGSPEEMGKSLSKLDNKKLGFLISELQTSGVSNIGNRVTSLYGSSMAFRGGLGGAQASRAFAGPGATLLSNLDQMDQILKEHPELTEIERMAAWEHISGKTGDEAQQLYRLGLNYKGRNDVLTERQMMVKQMLAEGKDPYKEVLGNKEKDIDAFGVYVNERGQRVRATKTASGEYAESVIGDSFDDLILSLGQELAGLQAEQLPKDLIAAQEIAQNTGNMVDIERASEQLLSGIYDLVGKIYSWITGGSLTKSKVKGEAVQRAHLLGTASKQSARDLRDNISKLENLEMTGTEDQIISGYGSREALQQKIKLMKEKATEQEAMSAFYEKVHSKVVNTYGDDITSGDPDALISSSMQEVIKNNPEMAEVFSKHNYKNVEDSLARARSTDVQVYGPVRAPGGDLSGSINMSQMSTMSPEEQKQLLDIEKKADNNTTTKTFKQGQALLDATKNLPKDMIKANTEAEYLNFLGSLALDPITQQEYLNDLLSGHVPSEIEGDFKNYTFSPGGQAEALKHAMSKPAANDLLVQFGPNGPKWAHRVADNDIGVIAKPGGGLSKSGGSGGGTYIINNHMYNDARGNFKSITNYQKVLGRARR